MKRQCRCCAQSNLVWEWVSLQVRRRAAKLASQQLWCKKLLATMWTSHQPNFDQYYLQFIDGSSYSPTLRRWLIRSLSYSSAITFKLQNSFPSSVVHALMQHVIYSILDDAPSKTATLCICPMHQLSELYMQLHTCILPTICTHPLHILS